MKFAEHLLAHITPEWRKQYINYEEMKAMLYAEKEEADFPDGGNDEIEDEHLIRRRTQFDECFFHYCEDELKKINTFYFEKLAEATRKFSGLKSELEMPGKLGKRSGKFERPMLNHRKIQDLKLAFSEFYLNLILLQNYQNLNFTGFRKILKKHDKLLRTNSGTEWRIKNVEVSPFYTNNDINGLISDTEQCVTTYLEGGDRQKAMKRLRVPPLGEQQSPWITFKVGLFSGSFIVLLATVVLTAVFKLNHSFNWQLVFRLFRGPLLLVELLFLLGVNVYGWRSSGVNHVLIFELDPRNHLTEQHLMEFASILGVSWALAVLSMLFWDSLSIPPYSSPLALVVIMAVFLFNPLKTFRHEARFWLIKLIGRIVCAPFFHVNFADFWLADQFNSLVTVFLDFYFLITFYTMDTTWLETGDIYFDSSENSVGRVVVNCLPAWFRFAQCCRRYRDTREAFPHLANAGKYASSILATVTNGMFLASQGKYDDVYENPMFYVWFASGILSSTYAYTWDVKMDWGLLDTSCKEYFLLRDEIVYANTAFYYFAIIEDLILRYIWVFTFFFMQNGYLPAELVASFSAPLEVFRRFLWNYLRLEHEHLNNCGKFRAVRDISIAPITDIDPITLILMMDNADGVNNRKERKTNAKKLGRDDRVPLISNYGRESSQDSSITIDMPSI